MGNQEKQLMNENNTTAETTTQSTAKATIVLNHRTQESLEEYEASVERLAREFEEEAARFAQELAEAMPIELEEDEYTEEDYERDIEFGRLEEARDGHFSLLDKTDKEQAKYPLFEYLVDGLLPMNEVHVIAGETGAGKSTWLFDNFISPWQHEQAVLGRRSHWYPYVVFVNDRTKAGMIRMLQRLKLNPRQFPIESTITGDDLTLFQKIEKFHDANQALKVVFIEGLHVGQKDGNDYGESSQVMQKLNALCQKRRLTVIATTHVSKANAQQGGGDRTAIIGSSATPGMCETVFVLTKQKHGRVKLTVHARNERSFSQLYKWTEEGKLVETDETEDQDRFVRYLNQLPTETFKTEDAVQFYKKKFDLERDTVQKEIRRALDNEWIEKLTDEKGKVKKGHYRKVEVDWNAEEDNSQE